jgi:hypothetical protein
VGRHKVVDSTVWDSGITKCNFADDMNANGLIVGELCNYGGCGSFWERLR